MNSTEASLFWIVLCSVLAPLIAGLVPRKLVPEVVLLLLLGVAIGPNVLGWAQTTRPIELLRELGLGMLFLLAGYEIELKELTGPGGRRAAWTWSACPGDLPGCDLAAGALRRDPRRGRGRHRVHLDGTRHPAADPQGLRHARDPGRRHRDAPRRTR